jgi:SAM-dependent methyltransferase
VPTNPPLHELNPTTRFEDRAGDYANYRPSYPLIAIEAVIERLGPASALTIADIGAGTGISSRLLADSGARVLAIEPNKAMRSAAEGHARVEFLDGTAEWTGLPGACVDVVTSFQAFHWFNSVPALREFSRILRGQGRIALVWNERDSRDAFTAEYGIAINAAAGDHPSLNRSGVALCETIVKSSPQFRDVRVLRFKNSKRMNLSALLGGSMSGSYVPKSGPLHDQLVLDLTRTHVKFAESDGCVEMIYQTEMVLAEHAQ